MAQTLSSRSKSSGIPLDRRLRSGSHLHFLHVPRRKNSPVGARRDFFSRKRHVEFCKKRKICKQRSRHAVFSGGTRRKRNLSRNSARPSWRNGTQIFQLPEIVRCSRSKNFRHTPRQKNCDSARNKLFFRHCTGRHEQLLPEKRLRKAQKRTFDLLQKTRLLWKRSRDGFWKQDLSSHKMP